MASKKGSLNEIKAKASREEEKEGGELKERTFWPGGAAGKSGSVCRAVGCALLVMELLAATQDKCPTYVESGESEREGGRGARAPLRKWLQMPGVEWIDAMEEEGEMHERERERCKEAKRQK